MRQQKDPWVYIEDIGEVNVEDGTIRDVVQGDDFALKLARKVDYHNRQQKAHESAMRAAKRAFAKYALADDRKSVICGDLRGRWVNGHPQENQDTEAMRLQLSSVELRSEEWRELALAASGFSMKTLPDSLCEILAPFVSITETAGYVVVEPAPQLAPERRGPSPAVADREAALLDELTDSVAAILEEKGAKV